MKDHRHLVGYLVAFVLGLIVLSLVACEPRDASPTPAVSALATPTATPSPSLDPTPAGSDPLTNAAQRQDDLRSARFVLTKTTNFPQEMARQITIDGEIDSPNLRSRSRLQVDGQVVESEVILAGSLFYMRNGDVWKQIPVPTQWENPTDVDHWLAGAVGAKKEGAESVRGVNCPVYSYGLPRDAWPSLLPPAQEVALDDYQGKVCIGDDGFLRRLQGVLSGHKSAAASERYTMTMSLEFYALNDPSIQVVAPK